MKLKEINIIKIESLEKIHLIKKEWIEILRKTENSNVYSDPDFFSNAFKYRAIDSIPHIVLFKKQETPIGILLGWAGRFKVVEKASHSKCMKLINVSFGGKIEVTKFYLLIRLHH